MHVLTKDREHRMIRWLGLTGTGIVMLASCGPPARLASDEGRQCLPHALTVDSTAGHYAMIAWDPGCPPVRVLRGFNVYLSPTPLVELYPDGEMPSSILPFNRDIYPGDTIGDPDRETFECREIDNAVLYYAHVRAVYSDMTLSPPTNEIELVAYPGGEFTLMASYSGQQDGFSFAGDGYCRTDAVENDLYFFHRDGMDFLCSPSRLGPVNRNTLIYAAGSGESLGDISDLTPHGDHAEKMELRPGRLYILVTADGYPAKLRVKGIAGDGDSRRVVFEYIYKPPVIRAKVSAT